MLVGLQVGALTSFKACSANNLLDASEVIILMIAGKKTFMSPIAIFPDRGSVTICLPIDMRTGGKGSGRSDIF